jgi:hypothetical protein
MAKWHKYYRLSGYAFENCLRLHEDSKMLFKNGSYASAMHLSILAKEELGKAMMSKQKNLSWMHYEATLLNKDGSPDTLMTSCRVGLTVSAIGTHLHCSGKYIQAKRK